MIIPPNDDPPLVKYSSGYDRRYFYDPCRPPQIKHDLKYDPGQPRAPRGRPDGGEWVDRDGNPNNNGPSSGSHENELVSSPGRFGIPRPRGNPLLHHVTEQHRPPLPNYRSQASNYILKDWDDFNDHLKEIPDLGPTEKHAYRQVFAAEGGLQVAPNGATAGILPAALSDLKRKNPALAEKLKNIHAPEDLIHRPDLLPTVYEGYFDHALSNVGGRKTLEAIGNPHAAAALADTLFQHGRTGGAKITLNAVNSILEKENQPPINVEKNPDGSMPPIAVKERLLSTYSSIARSENLGALLDNMAYFRLQDRISKIRTNESELEVRKKLKGEIERFDHFRFENSRNNEKSR